jgi:hypothetical protein
MLLAHTNVQNENFPALPSRKYKMFPESKCSVVVKTMGITLLGVERLPEYVTFINTYNENCDLSVLILEPEEAMNKYLGVLTQLQNNTVFTEL